MDEFKVRHGQRDDPLQPKNFDPGDYTVVGFYDLQPPQNPFTDESLLLGLISLGVDTVKIRREQIEAVDRHIDKMRRIFGDDYARQCAHCGAHIRWAYAVRHDPTGRVFPFGEICGDERVPLANRDAFEKHLAKKAAENEKVQIQNLIVKAKFAAKHPTEVEFMVKLREEHGNWGYRDEFIQELANKFATYGSLSDKQLACVTRHMQKLVEWAERDKKRAEQLSLAPAVQAGRYEVIGEVQSVRERENEYGLERKMRLLADSGNGYWVSVPKLLVDRYFRALQNVTGDLSLGQFLKGMRVAVTASWEPAKDDEHFAFGKRPSVKVLD